MNEAPQSIEPEAEASGGAPFGCVARAWAAHESELLGYLRHRQPDRAAAEDLLQEVFVKALRQGPGFCTLDNPRAWLFRVAHNALVDQARGRCVAEPIEDQLEALAQPEAAAPPPVDALGDCLARVLAELPAQDAAVLRACELEGLTQRDFAARQGLSLAAVKSRVLRARQRLRKCMTQACQVRFDPDDGRVSGHVGRPRGGSR